MWGDEREGKILKKVGGGGGGGETGVSYLKRNFRRRILPEKWPTPYIWAWILEKLT